MEASAAGTGPARTAWQRLGRLDKPEVERLIREAWSGAEYPGDDRLAGQASCCGEYGYVAEYFRGKRWDELTLEHLLEHYEGPHYACTSFMSAEAYRYYFGAMMLMAMGHPEDTLGDSIVFSLSPWWDDGQLLEHVNSPREEFREWNETRWSGFSKAQRRAIVAYLEFWKEYAAKMGWGEDPQVDQALKQWRV